MAKGISNKKLEEIQALNKKLITKKQRIEKKYGVKTPEIQPIDTSLRGKALKDSIEQAQSFTNPHNQKYQYVKNKHGVVMTKSELTKIKLKVAQVNRIKKQELDRLDKLNYTHEGGHAESFKAVRNRAQATVDENMFLRFKPDSFTTRAIFNRWWEGKQKVYTKGFIERQQHQFRANYFIALERVFGDTSDVDQLKGFLEGLSLEEFYTKAVTSDEKDLQYIYEANRRAGILQKIGESWGVDLGLTLES